MKSGVQLNVNSHQTQAAQGIGLTVYFMLEETINV